MVRLRSHTSPLVPTAASSARVDQDATPTSTRTSNRTPATSPTMLHLAAKIKPVVDPNMYSAYETAIRSLEFRGPKSPQIRKKYCDALRKMVYDDDVLMKLHNECARQHNKEHEGKHMRFLLPVYEEKETDEAQREDVKMEKAKESERVSTTTDSEHDTSDATITDASGIATPNGNAKRAFQVDGAHDFEDTLKTLLEAPTMDDAKTAGEENREDLGRGARLIEELEQEFATSPSQDVDMEDLEDAELPTTAKSSTADDPIVSHEVAAEPEVTILDSNQHSERVPEMLEKNEIPVDMTINQTKGPSPIADAKESLNRPATPLRLGPTVEDEPIQLTGSRGDESVDSTMERFHAKLKSPILPSRTDFAQGTSVVMDNASRAVLAPSLSSVQNVESVQTDENGIDDAREGPVSPTPTVPASKPNKQSAISYLAWLHQRHQRFPKVPPQYPECIALSQSLGRSPHYVYDEILFHWGLETDSKHGERYRQNRLQELGEDPIFEEEKVRDWHGWYEAWNGMRGG